MRHFFGTAERITQKGKIPIIYAKQEEEREYNNYVSILQSEGLLDKTVEYLDVEDLQAVSGLKAMRVALLHKQHLEALRAESYEKLFQQL